MEGTATHCHPEAHQLIEMNIVMVGIPSKKLLMGGACPEPLEGDIIGGT